MGPAPLGTWRGRYTLESEIEQGGMAVIYEGFDRAFDRPVAIKTLGPDSPRWMQRSLEREACLGFRLSHPNIVRYLDYFEEDGYQFLVMEKLEGKTLADILDERTLNRTSLLQHLSRIARAVSACHESGIVHLDLKPSNIMILPDGRAKLMDFGLSRSCFLGGQSRRWLQGELRGTPHYMSPEMIEGIPGRLSPKADLYALGVMLYQILTGNLPHSGSDSGEIFRQTLEAPVLAPRFFDPKISATTEAICMRALVRNPSLRTQCALEFAQELEVSLGLTETKTPSQALRHRIPSLFMMWRSNSSSPDSMGGGSLYFGFKR
jgi:serine/threonine protein kinase